jgi:hypothetical protein
MAVPAPSGASGNDRISPPPPLPDPQGLRQEALRPLDPRIGLNGLVIKHRTG